MHSEVDTLMEALHALPVYSYRPPPPLPFVARIRKAVIDEVCWCLLALVLLFMFIHDWIVALPDWIVEEFFCCILAVVLITGFVTDWIWKENPPLCIARFFEKLTS
jgi:hypothetical protein